jgi:ribosomal protein S18 acetylase RimI-like enzyme
VSEVRLARPDEYEAVGRLTVDAYTAGGVLVADDGYAAVLADTRSRAGLAEVYVLLDDGGALVGTATLSEHGTPYAQVSRPGEVEMRMLAVDPASGGKGHGSRLVEFCAAQGRARGLHALVICVIDTNAAALRLYDRLGFVRRPDRDIDVAPDVQLLALTCDL